MALGVKIRIALLEELRFFVELSRLIVMALGRHDLNLAELFLSLYFFD